MSGKILITGGLGNLGSWITREFCNADYDVYVLTRNEKNKIPDIKYTVIEADITDFPSLKNKLSMKFDYCIHAASYNEFFEDNYAKKAIDINVLGTRNLLEVLSVKELKRFIYFSTFHVYGANTGLIKEDNTLNPKNDYASTHLFAEYYVKQFGANYNINYTIFRLTNSYGSPIFLDSTKWYLVLNELTKSAYENKEIILKSNGQASRDFIWMGDVTNITRKILESDSNAIYNLSSMESYKVIEIANLVKSEYEKRYNNSVQIILNSTDKNIYSSLVVDNSRLQEVIKFKPNNKFRSEINKIFDLLERK